MNEKLAIILSKIGKSKLIKLKTQIRIFNFRVKSIDASVKS